jgi:hypothetical protein
MTKATKQNTPSEQRKRRLARGLRRNHATTIETVDLKTKSLVKQTVQKPSSIDHKQYDKLVGRLMKEEDDENDDNFEPEKTTSKRRVE